jgi:hypothetical protein
MGRVPKGQSSEHSSADGFIQRQVELQTAPITKLIPMDSGPCEGVLWAASYQLGPPEKVRQLLHPFGNLATFREPEDSV